MGSRITWRTRTRYLWVMTSEVHDTQNKGKIVYLCVHFYWSTNNYTKRSIGNMSMLGGVREGEGVYMFPVFLLLSAFSQSTQRSHNQFISFQNQILQPSLFRLKCEEQFLIVYYVLCALWFIPVSCQSPHGRVTVFCSQGCHFVSQGCHFVSQGCHFVSQGCHFVSQGVTLSARVVILSLCQPGLSLCQPGQTFGHWQEEGTKEMFALQVMTKGLKLPMHFNNNIKKNNKCVLNLE